MFYDEPRVLARDCAASVARWIYRDPLGQATQPRLDAIEAPDDRTLVFRRNQDRVRQASVKCGVVEVAIG